jgi:lysyl-tRNA synthetase class II
LLTTVLYFDIAIILNLIEMTVKIEGFTEVFDILKEMFAGVKSAIQLPEKNKKEMRDAIANTAELIDETLTILKQHLTSILSELKFGDQQKAKRMTYELGSFQGWEEKYRQFQMCDSLREATMNLEKKGLYKLLSNLSYNDSGTIQQRMWDYIGGETNAANSVGTMLQDLSDLANDIETKFDDVVLSLEAARNEIAKWRQSFIDLEKEIRNSI